MKALVLVGGFGTRLRPITYEIPKQLIPIAGKPMLYHVLDLLPPSTEEVILASGYKSEVVAAFLQQNPPTLRVRCVPEAVPLGTGGGIKNASEGLTDPFLLLNSDVIADIDVPALIDFDRRKGGVGTMTLSEVDDPEPYGVAALDGADRIARFVEKPKRAEAPSRWINAGLSVWRRSVLEEIPAGRPVSFETEVVPRILSRGIYGFRARGFWEDAGTPARLLHAQRLLFDAGRGGPGELPPHARGKGPVAVAAGAELDGPTFGPYVTLGAGVRIGSGATVENSVLMDGVTVGKGATVRGSILGPGVVVPAGDDVVDAVRGTTTGA